MEAQDPNEDKSLKKEIKIEVKEPFDIEINNIDYAIFPEEDQVYTVFKDGAEYVKIIKDTENSWLKLDQETELPRFEADEEINAIGREIIAW